MIKIENNEYKDYELKLDYKYNEFCSDDFLESVRCWPMQKIKERDSDMKTISVSPVFTIKTKIGTELYDYLDCKKNKMFDEVTGCRGFKKDYVFDLSFDDKFDSSDIGVVHLCNAFIESSETDVDGTVTVSVICDHVYASGGCYEFLNYIGNFEVPKTIYGNYTEYLKTYAHKRF